MSSQTIDSELEQLLSKGPSFVNAEPAKLSECCLISRASLQLVTDRLVQDNIPDRAI